MSIVRDEDFDGEYPKWYTDPNISEEDKKLAMEIAGAPERTTWTHHVNFDDDCLLCGEKLSVPFVFWSGCGKDICLHPRCAALLGGALMRDFLETRDGKEAADHWWRDEMKPTIRPD